MAAGSDAAGGALMGARPGACLAILLAARVAAAASPSPRAQLVYAREGGAQSCPDEEALRHAVSARLGYDPFSREAPRTITVSVRGAGRGLAARIVLSDATGEASGRRELASPRSDCGDLGPAIELAVALAIDPLGVPLGAAGGTLAPESPSDERSGDAIAREFGGDSRATPELAATPPRRPPPPPARPSNPTRVRAGLGVLLGAGAAGPRAVNAGFTLHLGFRERAWSVGIELRGDLPATSEVNAMEDGKLKGVWPVRAALVLGLVVPCLHWPYAQGRIEVAACLIVGGGAQFASGRFVGGRSAVGGTPQVGARAALEVPLGRRFALRGQVEMLVAPNEVELIVGEQGEWFKVRQLSGAFGAALLVYLN